MKRETLINLVFFFLFLGLGVSGFLYLKKTKPGIDKRESERKKPLLRSISTKPVSAGISIDAFGTMQSRAILQVRPEIAGKISYINPQFFKGGQLKKGEVLFKIETRDYELSLKKASANLTLRKSQYNSLLREHENLKANQKLLEENLSLSQKELKRYEGMLKEKTVSPQDYENSKIRTQNHRINLQNLKNQLNLMPVRLEQAQTNIEIARADFESAGTDLERASYKVPYGVRVQEKLVSVGTFVNRGGLVATVANIDELEIEVPIPAHELPWLFPDRVEPNHANVGGLVQNKVQVEILSPGSGLMEGQITRLGSELDPGTRSLPVFISLSPMNLQGEPSRYLMPGTFCKVSFQGRELINVVRIPRSAHNQDEVLLVREGKVHSGSVKILRDEGDTLLISHNFKPGDEILRLYSEFVSVGQKVKTSLQELP